MATGLPVVNTHSRTTVPLVAPHDQEAITVQPNDPSSFAQALNSVLDQPALAKRLGTSAYTRVSNELAQNTFRARMAAVYNDAIRAREVLK